MNHIHRSSNRPGELDAAIDFPRVLNSPLPVPKADSFLKDMGAFTMRDIFFERHIFDYKISLNEFIRLCKVNIPNTFD